MKNIYSITLLLICLSNVIGQNRTKLSVKITPSRTTVNPYNHAYMKAWLYNNGTSSISIFRQDYTAPAWLGVIENWYCTFKQKTDTFPKLMEEPTSGFNENNIINIRPGDSLLVDSMEYTFYEHGNYTFTYNIMASRNKVILYYALTPLAKKKALAITPFNITSQPVTVICEPVIYSSEEIIDLPLDEVTKYKKQVLDLAEAFKNPKEVFRLSLKGDLMQRDLRAINQLKNIHSLQLSNITIKDNDEKNNLIFDLPNLKELVIKDSQIEITDTLFEGLSKLEKILFKNVSYRNPSNGFNNLTKIKSIIMTDCKINSLTADFSKLRDLVRIELNKNNLKEIPAITNLPKLEYIDIRENKLVKFPEISNVPTLKNIYLAKNEISTIPGSIGRLKTLVNLDLSWNNISSIPPEMSGLEALTTLRLTGNQISKLPDKFKNLSSLQVLALDENKYSTVDPVILKISTLEQLSLSNNNITMLPDKFGKLALLSQLDISENKISQLPKSLLRLKNLRILNVKGNPVNEDKTSDLLRAKLKNGYND